MVSWETGYNLPPSVVWAGFALTQAPEVVEYPTKPVVLPQPESIPILLSPSSQIGLLAGRPRALCPGGISRVSSFRLPLPAPVKEIPQEEQRVRLQMRLELDV